MHRPRHQNRGQQRKQAASLAMTWAIVVVTLVTSGLFAADHCVPQLAPEFTLPNLDGMEISLSDYLGNIVILDFWASWCKPCTQTLPDIHALEAAYAEQGVVLLILCFDKCEEDARSYLIENEYGTENVLWGSLKEARAVRDLFGVEAITHTLVIGPEGYIRYSGHPSKLTSEVLEPWLLDEDDAETPEEDASA